MTDSAATTPPAPDRSDLDAVRALLVRMIAEGQGDDAVALVIQLLSDMRDENVTLMHRLREALRMLYGRRSEKLTPQDKALLSRMVGVEPTPDGDASADPTASSGDGATGSSKPKKTLPEGAAHGRGGDKPKGLSEKRTKSPVPERERTCPQCGGALGAFGHVDDWQVEYVPGHFEVRTTEREQLSCRHCRDVVVIAPAPPKVIAGSNAGAGLLAKILVDKGEDHLPIERQQRRLEREGLTVPITTLSGWWSQAADLLLPVHNALRREAMQAWLPQVDGTGLDVLDRDHPKGIRAGTIWTAVGGRAVVFVYTRVKGQGLRELIALRGDVDGDGNLIAKDDTTVSDDEVSVASALDEVSTSDDRAQDDDTDEERREDTPERMSEAAGSDELREIDLPVRGPFQCDGEHLFGSLWRKLGFAMVLVHCWMHARRYFERAMKAKDLRASVAMKLIGQMYEIERRATAEGVSVEERARRRQSETWPLLESLREWVLQIAPTVAPSSPLGKAISYVQRRWLSLTVFVLDGRIPLDNGEVERAIRRIAVGRNNWLFTGSHEAAQRLCIVASLCATCRKLGIDPWAYLRDALLAAGSGMSARRLAADFTPWAWAQKQTQQPNTEKVDAGNDIVAA